MNFLRRHFPILAIILLGAALRFYHLGENSLWDGEIFTLFHSQKDLPALIASLRDFGAHPPLWFFITKLATAGRWNETMLRFPSAYAGVLAIPAIYILGKRVANYWVGIVAALLLALSPLDVLYSQAGRMYAIMVPLALLALYCIWRGLQISPLMRPSRSAVVMQVSVLSHHPPPPLRSAPSVPLRAPRSPAKSAARTAAGSAPSGSATSGTDALRHGERRSMGGWRWWLGAAVFCALALYTQYLALFFIGSVYLFAGVVLLVFTYQEFPLAGKNVFEWLRAYLLAFFRRSAKLWASFGFMILLYVPWFPIVLQNFVERQLAAEAEHAGDRIHLTPSYLYGLFLDLSGSDVLFVILGVLALVALAYALYHRDWKTWLAVFIWFVPVFLVVAILKPRRFPSRYVMHLLPMYLLLAAWGLVLMREASVRFLARARERSGVLLAVGRRGFVAAVLLVVIVALTVGELSELYSGSRQIFRGEEAADLLLRAEWRQLGQKLMNDAAAGDFLVYGGDGPRRPPRFLAPYESSEFQNRVHGIDPRTLTRATIWWIGIQPDSSELQNFANGADTTPYDFDQVQAARITRPARFSEVELSDPGFESDQGGGNAGDKVANNGIPDGWTLIKSNGAARQKEKGIEFALDSNHAVGATSLQATYSPGNDAELDSSEFAVVPGQLFRATVLVRDVTTGFYTESPGLDVEFLDAKGKTNFLPLEPMLLPWSSGGGWQLEVLDGAVPDGAVTAHVALLFKDFARPYHAATWVDDVHVYLERLTK